MVFYKIFNNYNGILCFSFASAGAAIALNKLKNGEIDQVTPTKDHLKQTFSNEGKIQRARKAVFQYMTISGATGLSVGVTKDGRQIWKEGFGFADVETGAKCTGDSVMRIASISKCLTATIAARLMERGKLDLDKSIHEYLTEEEFPKKNFDGKEVTITARQLLSHTSGIRHYPKKDENAPDSTDPVEFMSNKRYKSVTEALEMFKADPLLSQPGTQYHYTTHGFTLLSAVLEKAAQGKEFKQQLDELFRRLNMWNTRVDDAQEPIVIDRTRYYKRNGSHRLENVREVDNSYKLAGGGILSNVTDLLNFANAILYSYHTPTATASFQTGTFPLLLKPTTIREMWTRHSEHIDEKTGKKLGEYGLAWSLASPTADEWKNNDDVDGKIQTSREANGTNKNNDSQGQHSKFEPREYWFVCWEKTLNVFSRYHTGGAVGTSSVLLITPRKRPSPFSASATGFDHNNNICANTARSDCMPAGVCVAILVNCQDCSCRALAIELARIFADEEEP